MKVRVGDVVHVRGTVVSLDSDGAIIAFNNKKFAPVAHSLWSNPNTIVHVEQKPLQVGDKVQWPQGYVSGKIEAIVGDRAWVSNGAADWVAPLSELVRA